MNLTDGAPDETWGDGGVTDFIGISYHGYVTTHVDALCHAGDGPAPHPRGRLEGPLR